ncbi:MAG: protein BatD [Bacteroidales bacterium]|nr:protein BatD [Bacteroidales bacterium]
MTVVRYFRKLSFALLLCVCSAVMAQNTFVVDAPRVVEKSEAFRVVFTADGEISNFTKPVFTGLDVLAGPSPSRMSSVQIINGKRTDKIEISYTYIVRPSASGTAKISGASATIDGKVYTTKEFSIDVVEDHTSAQGNSNTQSQSQSQAQDGRHKSVGDISSEEVFLSLSFSKKNVVKGEPIVATLKLYTRVDIAGFEDIKFPVFNGFWSQEIETPQNINFIRESVDGKIYNSAVLRKYMLLPQQTGDIVVNPAEMICQVQVSVRNTRPTNIFDDFFDQGYQIVRKRITSKATTIHVKPLPGGAPESFGGGVGKFSLDVSLNRDEIKAHDAASLIVDVTGSGNLNLIESPKVNLPADFETYASKTDNKFTNGANGISGKKRFEFPFIPRSEGRFVMDPIVYSYYDIDKKKYVTISSDSIVINVLKGEATVTTATVQGLTKQAVANIGEDIRYIKSGNPLLMPTGKFVITSWYFYVMALALLAVAAGAAFLLQRNIKLKGDIKRFRNKKANKVARTRLMQAQVYLKENLYSSFYEELHKALLGYISDKLSISFAQMQRDTIKETLVAKSVSEQNINDFMELLDDCEMARYSQSGKDGQMELHYKKAIDTISNLEDRL